jgi:hypothetical protein
VTDQHASVHIERTNTDGTTSEADAIVDTETGNHVQVGEMSDDAAEFMGIFAAAAAELEED